MKIVFQGDSITDGGRDKRNYHELGHGYASFAAKYIKEAHPEMDIEFINMGVSGNRSGQVFDRIYPDAIAFAPDVFSILVGVNDTWHRYSHNIGTTDEQYELNLRCILERVKKETNAKILVMSPYLLDHDVPPRPRIREDLKTIIPIVKRLADEYADVYVPLQEHFDKALPVQPESHYYSADGIHPNQNGADFIGRIYADAVEPLLK